MLRPAVATSAAYFARKRVGLTRVSPIVHPHTGKPLRSNVSVSVFSRTCMEADALTKAVLLAPQAGHSLAELQVKYPNVPSTVIPQKLYGALDAVEILDLAQKTAKDY